MSGPKIELAAFRDLVAQGLNAPAIAARLGVTRAAVYLFDEKHRTGLKKAARADRKIDPDRLARLVWQGRSTAQIAAQFGVRSPDVITACHKHELPLPGSPQALAGARNLAPADPEPAPDLASPEPAPAAPMNESDRCEAELIASGGTHAALAAWAAKWGTSHASARARWARLKLPLAFQRRR
jgi:hypothetical protein